MSVLKAGLVLALAGSISACATNPGPRGAPGNSNQTASGTQRTLCSYNLPRFDAQTDFTTAIATAHSLNASYDCRADRIRQRRNALTNITLLSSFGAVINAVTDGSTRATSLFGLSAAGASTASPTLSRAAEGEIYRSGQRALNCLVQAAPNAAMGLGVETAITQLNTTSEPVYAAYQDMEARYQDLRSRSVDVPPELLSYYRSLVARYNRFIEARRASASTAQLATIVTHSLRSIDTNVDARLDAVSVNASTSLEGYRDRLVRAANGAAGQAIIAAEVDEPASSSSFIRAVRPFATALDAMRDALRGVEPQVRTILANPHMLEFAQFETDATACIAISAGSDVDSVVLLNEPATINLAAEGDLNAVFQVSGGNAPYLASWAGTEPAGYALTAIDTGTGRFRITVDRAAAPSAGQYPMLVMDEDQRPLIVMLESTGQITASTPPAQPQPNNSAANRPALEAFDTFPDGLTAHANCRIGLAENADADVQATQTTICQHLGEAADWAQLLAAGTHFVIDGLPGCRTDHAASYFVVLNDANNTAPAWRSPRIQSGRSFEPLPRGNCEDGLAEGAAERAALYTQVRQIVQ